MDKKLILLFVFLFNLVFGDEATVIASSLHEEWKSERLNFRAYLRGMEHSANGSIKDFDFWTFVRINEKFYDIIRKINNLKLSNQQFDSLKRKGGCESIISDFLYALPLSFDSGIEKKGIAFIKLYDLNFQPICEKYLLSSEDLLPFFYLILNSMKNKEQKRFFIHSQLLDGKNGLICDVNLFEKPKLSSHPKVNIDVNNLDELYRRKKVFKKFISYYYGYNYWRHLQPINPSFADVKKAAIAIKNGKLKPATNDAINRLHLKCYYPEEYLKKTTSEKEQAQKNKSCNL